MSNENLDKHTVLIVATNNSAAKSNILEQKNLLFDNNVEIVGLQEIDNNTERNPYNMLEKFSNDYNNIFFSKAMDFSGGEYGIAIASKYKFKKTKSEKLSNVLDNKNVEARVYQRVVIVKEGKQIAFYNTHLSWESNMLRNKQMKELKLSMDNDLCEYVIAVGDFNADKSYKEYDLFKDDYNLANGRYEMWLDTFNGDDKSMIVNSIDNILVSKNIEIKDIKMIDAKLSDHNPLIAKLILK